MPPDPASNSRKLKVSMEVQEIDILAFEGDGIVMPTNSEGLMVEGVAARVKAVTGKVIENEALRHAPIAVGAAIVTQGGTLPIRYIIHVPLVEEPGMKVGIENIRRATRAGLLAATHFQMERIAIPGMGYGDEGVPHDEAARAIIDEIRAYRNIYPAKVTLLDEDSEMRIAFSIELGEL